MNLARQSFAKAWAKAYANVDWIQDEKLYQTGINMTGFHELLEEAGYADVIFLQALDMTALTTIAYEIGMDSVEAALFANRLSTRSRLSVDGERL